MIRPAIASDVPRLVELGREFFAEAAWADVAEWDDDCAAIALANLIENPVCVMLVACDDTHVIGMSSVLMFPLWFNPKVTMAQEWFWYVTPYARGGIGVKLLMAIEAEMIKRGVQVLEMQSVQSLPSLDSIYIRMAYRPAEKTFIKRLA